MEKELSMEMTPQEKFESVNILMKTLEEKYLMLGQVLSDIKRKGSFKIKGYKSFKNFVEVEYNLKSSLAAKIIKAFELYSEELDIDEAELKQIGFERLDMVRPFVEKAESYAEQEEWIECAKGMNTADLKDKIKEIRQQEKENKRSSKDLLIEQYLENMVTFFNCSRKELDFKLALYFQDADLDDLKEIIKERQRRFEDEATQGGQPV